MDWKWSTAYSKIVRSDFFFFYFSLMFVITSVGSLTDKDFYLNPVLHVFTSIFIFLFYVFGLASIGVMFEFQVHKNRKKHQNYLDEYEKNLQQQIKKIKEDFESMNMEMNAYRNKTILVDYYGKMRIEDEDDIAFVKIEPSPWFVGDWQQHLK